MTKSASFIALVLVVLFDLLSKGEGAEFKRYTLSESVKETVPYTNEAIFNLVSELKNIVSDQKCFKSEQCAQVWMKKYNYVKEKIVEKSAFLEFTFATDINDNNEKLLNEFAPIFNKFTEQTKDSLDAFLKSSQDWDANLKRQIFIASQGLVFKDSEDALKFSGLSSKLESIYGTAKVCEADACFSLDPDLTATLKGRDYDKLLWAWKGWHDATGPKMRSTYTEAVKVLNKRAVQNGYKDQSVRWIKDFEEEDFEKDMDDLFREIKPFYEQLHAYVRRKLRSVYGSKYPASHDPKLIPAHLLGNMWAQSWDNIYSLVTPFPNEPSLDLTKKLVEQNYTALQIFKQAEDFFVSLGLYKMTPTFWKFSQLVKPQNKSVQCHASATDLVNGFDYRVKMCTSVVDEDFYTVHHELGHIEYFMAYGSQPTVFRDGANSAFHEAIGDTISLSVMSHKYLKRINIIDNDAMTHEQEINFLMETALKKIAFMPFGYLMDKWKWDVFRGRINETNYNEKWWLMRKEFQGLESAVPRVEADFDAGAKYHTSLFYAYSSYFISHFLQFQFYESLCKLAQHKGALHTCDFYGSKDAGDKLKKMLELGSSKHWSEALNLLTGEKVVQSRSILDYFQPLIKWLKEENDKHPEDKPGFS